ncbi:MAG TPA: reverse transcriptase family protein [Blastocatellia bacterium]|nr:reverse transcriptase family protein [Blastocatellia bacterium]
MTAPAVQPRTREELYEQIRNSSKEEFILTDMIRLGFWPAQGTIPHDPADEIRRRAELQRELDELRRENQKLYNEQALLKEMRKRRLAESKQKQKETKERRERERQQRAEAWRQKKEKEIVYLGAEVSGGLNHTTCDAERLESYGLPRYDTVAEIAEAMGITVGELRFLAFSRKTATTTHYVRFRIPKKTGGERVISAPMPRLKQAQHWILHNILEKVALDDTAHGFRAGRSIVSNARPHVGAEAIINLDLQDFFPSIAYRRVRGVFRSLGYSEAAATIFGLICTEPEVEKVGLDGRTYYVALTDRHLPQGAPTSPAITNILCRRLDRRLTKMAEELGFTYTRYADDLTFSASGDQLKNICNVLRRTESIVAHEGLVIHPAKTRVMRKSRQQEVTGIVVNSKPNVDRETLRRFRATLYQVEKDGPDGKRWGHAEDVIASLRGFANFVYMVDPKKGAEYRQRVHALIEKYGWQPRPAFTIRAARQKSVPTNAADGNTGNTESQSETRSNQAEKKWWKLW